MNIKFEKYLIETKDIVQFTNDEKEQLINTIQFLTSYITKNRNIKSNYNLIQQSRQAKQILLDILKGNTWKG